MVKVMASPDVVAKAIGFEAEEIQHITKITIQLDNSGLSTVVIEAILSSGQLDRIMKYLRVTDARESEVETEDSSKDGGDVGTVHPCAEDDTYWDATRRQIVERELRDPIPEIFDI